MHIDALVGIQGRVRFQLICHAAENENKEHLCQDFHTRIYMAIDCS